MFIFVAFHALISRPPQFRHLCHMATSEVTGLDGVVQRTNIDGDESTRACCHNLASGVVLTFISGIGRQRRCSPRKPGRGVSCTQDNCASRRRGILTRRQPVLLAVTNARLPVRELLPRFGGETSHSLPSLEVKFRSLGNCSLGLLRAMGPRAPAEQPDSSVGSSPEGYVQRPDIGRPLVHCQHWDRGKPNTSGNG